MASLCFQYFLDSCFKDYTLYIGVVMLNPSYIASPYQCQYLCITTFNCVAFNFHKWYSQCTLLSSVSSNITDAIFISGFLTDCSGTIGNMLLFKKFLEYNDFKIFL